MDEIFWLGSAAALLLSVLIGAVAVLVVGFVVDQTLMFILHWTKYWDALVVVFVAEREGLDVKAYVEERRAHMAMVNDLEDKWRAKMMKEEAKG